MSNIASQTRIAIDCEIIENRRFSENEIMLLSTCDTKHFNAVKQLTRKQIESEISRYESDKQIDFILNEIIKKQCD